MRGLAVNGRLAGCLDLPSAGGSETVRTTEDVVAGVTEALEFVTALVASGAGAEVLGAAVWSPD